MDLCHSICLISGISTKAELLDFKGTAGQHSKEMPEKLRDSLIEAVHILREQCELEVWLYSHRLLDCHERYWPLTALQVCYAVYRNIRTTSCKCNAGVLCFGEVLSTSNFHHHLVLSPVNVTSRQTYRISGECISKVEQPLW